MQYLVGVTDTDGDGSPKGTHHVSATVSDCPEKAKSWAINDTACDWGFGDQDRESLHVLFVMRTPVSVSIDVVEYDEGVV